jgi:hypothetical protein
MTNSVYCALFLGQFGETLSWGIEPLAKSLRELGCMADVYDYQNYQQAEARCFAQRKTGAKIALIGFSLGDSTATYIQESMPTDLLICIAESSLARNYKVNKKNTKRSILFHGADFLSNAGLDAGFDKVFELPWYDLHLGADVDPKVFEITQLEVKALLEGA